MSLLDEIAAGDKGVEGVRGDGVGTGITIWKPATEREHPVGIEGVIAVAETVKNKMAKEGQDPDQWVLVVITEDGANTTPWKVYGGARELHDKFAALAKDRKLTPGRQIAMKYDGKINAVAKDGTKYSYFGFIVKTGELVSVPTVTGTNADGVQEWSL